MGVSANKKNQLKKSNGMMGGGGGGSGLAETQFPIVNLPMIARCTTIVSPYPHSHAPAVAFSLGHGSELKTSGKTKLCVLQACKR